MESGAAMSNDAATAPTRTCEVCGATAADDQNACGSCGAQLGAAVPTGSRPPAEPTNPMTLPSTTPVSALASAPAEAQPERPQFTRAGLPTRRPREVQDDAAALDAFTRSWEAGSD